MSKFVSRPSVVASEIENGMALLDLDENIYFSLNRTGAVVWRAIEQPRSIEEICAVVAENFRTSPEGCVNDIIQLMDRLVEARLAYAVDAAAP